MDALFICVVHVVSSGVHVYRFLECVEADLLEIRSDSLQRIIDELIEEREIIEVLRNINQSFAAKYIREVGIVRRMHAEIADLWLELKSYSAGMRANAETLKLCYDRVPKKAKFRRLKRRVRQKIVRISESWEAWKNLDDEILIARYLDDLYGEITLRELEIVELSVA